MPKRLALFASGNGSNALNVIQYFEGNPQIEVALVAGENPGAGIWKKLAAYPQIPVLHLEKQHYKDGEWLAAALQAREIDYILLAGYLKLIPSALISHFPQRILNLHPSLLPKYGGKGMYGHHVHEAVLAAGETQSGITVHLVNEEFDKGEIIFQASFEIPPNCTVSELQQRINALELQNLPRVVEQFVLKD